MLHILQYILYVILSIIWIFTSQECGTYEAWSISESKAYFRGSSLVNFSQANYECQIRRAHLPVIINDRETNFIAGGLPNNGQQDNYKHGYWLDMLAPDPICGCSSHCAQCRERWHWRDGSPMTYMKWAATSPIGENRMCVQIRRAGDWSDTSCGNADQHFHNICQYDCSNIRCHIETCAFTDGEYVCSCIAGYTGEKCDMEIDECNSSPCTNNATCRNLVNEYQCSCVNGTEGPSCEINPNDCEHTNCYNGVCVDGLASYTCKCNRGYTGTQCETDLDECMSSPCKNTGTCLDEVDGFRCNCVDEFTGDTCQRKNDGPEEKLPTALVAAQIVTALTAFASLTGCAICGVCYYKKINRSKKYVGSNVKEIVGVAAKSDHTTDAESSITNSL